MKYQYWFLYDGSDAAVRSNYEEFSFSTKEELTAFEQGIRAAEDKDPKHVSFASEQEVLDHIGESKERKEYQEKCERLDEQIRKLL